MKKQLLSIVLGILIPCVGIAEDQQPMLPLNSPCIDTSKLAQLISQYNELPFANGMGTVMSSTDNQYYNGKITIFLSPEKTFTIVAELDPGVHCLLTTGQNFNPIIPGTSL